MRVVIGEGSCGIAAGAAKVHSKLHELLEGTDISVGIAGCIGMCFLEPIIDIYDEKTLLKRLVKVKEADAETIADALNKNDFEALKKYEISEDDSVFLSKQTRIALRPAVLLTLKALMRIQMTAAIPH